MWVKCRWVKLESKVCGCSGSVWVKWEGKVCGCSGRVWVSGRVNNVGAVGECGWVKYVGEV